MKLINKVVWKPYIKRKNAFFYVLLFNKAYGKLLSKETGFGFKHQMYEHKEGLVTFYKSEDDLKRARDHFLDLIKKKDPRLKEWYQAGLDSVKQKKELIEMFSNIDNEYIIKNYDELVNRLYSIYLYHTTIPFMLLGALDKREGHEKIVEMFERFRKQSLNSLHTLILDKFWKAAAELTESEDYMNFSYFTPKELGKLFKGQNYPNKEEIEKRKNNCIFFEKNNEIVFDYKGLHINQEFAETNELKGSTAFKGFAKARACVINKPYDMHKFRNGDIIVSINSTPDLMPILTRSSGIVTDEGGLTCHASIISRELEKPCVIGTKHATNIFKDGDIVELDADSGIVRKINKFEDYSKKDWIGIYAGRWGFLTCSYLGHFHTRIIKNNLGFGFKHFIALINKGYSEAKYEKKDYERFGKQLGNLVKKDKSVALYWSGKLKQEADTIRKFMDNNKSKVLTSKEFLKFLKSLSYYTVAHVFVKQIVNFVPETLLNEILPSLEEARLYAEQVFVETEQFMYQLADQINRKTGHKQEHILNITKEEYLKFADDNELPELDIMIDRNNSALIFEDGVYELLTGKNAEELGKAIHSGSENIIKGQSAHHGKVKGIVRIILEPDKADQFNKGDILVTGMTRPDFLPLMEKAAAVVTDAGGILCHAAIVARELKIPTVIGTEKATKVFKDGDYVEVDAEKGTVRKVEK